MLVASALSFHSQAQDDNTIREYINAYKELAISEMQRTGVPASIKLAQGIHETMAGTSVLVKKSNNHFGIKCKSNWTGESVSHTDDAPDECFRKYSNPMDSYRDHSDFLKSSPRYATLFKLDPLDYKDWAYGLKKAGYATNPRYPQVIIKLIEDYNLQEYCLIALGKAPRQNELMAKVTADQQQTDVIPAVATTTVASTTMQSENKPAYPSGEFKINETRVVYVNAGTSFLSLANQYNVPLARIFEFNDMKESETAEKDQLVYLQRKRRTGNNEFHIVKEGETLNDIASEEAIRIEALLEYNFLTRSIRPATGEQLYLRSKAPSAPKLEK